MTIEEKLREKSWKQSGIAEAILLSNALAICKEYAEEQIKEHANQECVWFDDGEYYLTSCHHNFVLMDSTLEDSKEFKYCPYCGRKIKEDKWPLATEEETKC